MACFGTVYVIITNIKLQSLISQKQEQVTEGNADLSGPHMIFTYKVFDYNVLRPVEPVDVGDYSMEHGWIGFDSLNGPWHLWCVESLTSFS